jgi:hypothetical protein
MNRRTLIRRIGASGLATTAFAGSASAAHTPGSQAGSVEYGIDREIDVADLSGAVTLAELLEPHELDGLPSQIDPRQREIIVQDDAGSITLGDCCEYCCDQINVCDCDGGCCECNNCLCDSWSC